jgi:hypothetical protein
MSNARNRVPMGFVVRESACEGLGVLRSRLGVPQSAAKVALGNADAPWLNGGGRV